MSAVVRRIQAQLFDPMFQDSCALAGTKMGRAVQPAGEQEVVGLQARSLDPLLKRVARGRGDLELHWLLRLVLHDDCA